MKIVVTGPTGYLARFIILHLKSLGHEVITLTFNNLDPDDYELITQDAGIENCDVVINCAAYTSVDKAEQNTEIAEQVNSIGVSNLVKALEKVNGKLIHISTDYVFNGHHFMPYNESDSVSPIGVYGETKREGELAVINSTLDAIVIRTSWLYSSYGNNFVKTMLRLGKQKKSWVLFLTR